jgi:enolase
MTTIQTSNVITSVYGRQVFDSRGRPTVEVEVTLAGGATGRACSPSGASTGRHEAHELRDGDRQEYEGRGVRKAVGNVNTEIARALAGQSAGDQFAIDTRMRELDGTPDLSRLGANNLPLYRYIASLVGNTEPTLPMPMVNILSGGAHAAQSMDLQDFLAVPIGARDFNDAMLIVSRVRRAAEIVMSRRNLPVFLADEGGLCPGVKEVNAALDMMVESIQEAGLVPGRDVAIAIDVAASELFEEGAYHLRGEGKRLSNTEMTSMVLDCLRQYPVVSVEDALDQDSWDDWVKLTGAAPEIQILGDDLFATNEQRIAQGIELGAANAVLIKINQNGTLSGTLQAIELARGAGYATVVSARSGETEDPFIADLAVGTGAGQIKIGSVRTSERLSKYNQLIRIAEDPSVAFSGAASLASGRSRRAA